jgi:hypothetical protein
MSQTVQLKRKNAEEHLVQLKKKVTLAVKTPGLEGQRARVALALDISVSMRKCSNKALSRKFANAYWLWSEIRR